MRILVAAVALVFGAALAQTATAQSGADLARQSVAAQGGAAALSSAKTTIIKGEAKHWEPGQSYSPTGEARFLGDSTYTQIISCSRDAISAGLWPQPRSASTYLRRPPL